MLFSDGRINAVTVAADRAGGFTTGELQRISESMALLGRLFEVHVLRRTARTILETYLGHLTGERVLDGQIKRGDGEDMHAVIWFCDLRGSTKLAERLPRSQYLALLNEYFEAMAGAVLANGGEVLSYIGDAVLAIYPIGAPGDCVMPCPRHVKACELALAAAMDAMGRMDALNGDRAAKGERPLRFGIALHLGDVMYGNIGVPERLSFTVIGSATNQASRIESMTKVLDKQLLVSSAIADVIPGRLVSLGFHALRGVSEPCEIFTLP
jgi:adenylate cyclase